MEPYETYQIYTSLRLHFSSNDYDCIKYNFKAKTTMKAFMGRKDRYHFAKMGKRFGSPGDLVRYLVPQFLADKSWVGDMLDKDSEERYAEYVRRHESLTYMFDRDLGVMRTEVPSFDDLFGIDEEASPYPRVISMYLSDMIMIESVVVLDKMVGYIEKANEAIVDPILWPRLYTKIRKYRPFVLIDRDRMRDKILSHYSE